MTWQTKGYGKGGKGKGYGISGPHYWQSDYEHDDYHHSQPGKGKGKGKGAGVFPSDKVWIFCKNKNVTGCNGSCYIGNNIPDTCKFCHAEKAFPVPKKLKYLIPTKRAEGTKETPQPVNAQLSSESISKLGQILSTNSSTISSEVQQQIRDAIGLAKPKTKTSNNGAGEKSYQSVKKAELDVSNLTNSLVGKRIKQARLQKELAEFEAEVSEVEKQLLLANEAVAKAKYNLIGVILPKAAEPSQEALQAPEKALQHTFSLISNSQRDHFSQDDCWQLMCTLVNQLAGSGLFPQPQSCVTNPVPTPLDPPNINPPREPAEHQPSTQEDLRSSNLPLEISPGHGRKRPPSGDSAELLDGGSKFQCVDEDFEAQDAIFSSDVNFDVNFDAIEAPPIANTNTPTSEAISSDIVTLKALNEKTQADMIAKMKSQGTEKAPLLVGDDSDI